jgi:hypothetical protein
MSRRALAAAAVAAALAAPLRAAERLSVEDDARVDLAAAFLYSAGGGGFGAFSGPGGWSREGAALARSGRAPEQTALMARLRARGFDGRFPLQYALYLSTADARAEAAPAPSLFADAAGGADELAAWRAALAEFSALTGFRDWRERRAEKFRGLARGAGAVLDGKGLEQALVDYLGVRVWERVVLIPSPFVARDRDAYWIVETPSRRPTVVVIAGPRWSGGKPSLGTAEDVSEDLWSEAVSAAGYALIAPCRAGIDWAPDVCRGAPNLGAPEDCAERLWLEAIEERLSLRRFGRVDREQVRRARRMPAYGRVLAAMTAFEARTEGDFVSWGPRLLAPLTRSGAPPECSSREGPAGLDPQLRYWRAAYLEGALERGPDAAASAELARLREPAPR